MTFLSPIVVMTLVKDRYGDVKLDDVGDDDSDSDTSEDEDAEVL